ncbi:glycoprotein endo-alpha-1,2-mannosidase [Sergentomyia squamirostris]
MTFFKLFKATKMMKLVPFAILLVCGFVFVVRVDENKSAKVAKIEINSLSFSEIPTTPKTVTTIDGVKKNIQPVFPEKYNEANVRSRLMREKIKRLMAKNQVIPKEEIGLNGTEFTRHVHIFYYAPVKWYKNATRDGPAGQETRETPNIIFYPVRGLYKPSAQLFREHCKDIRSAGVGVIVISWTPRLILNTLKDLLNAAERNNLKVAVSIDSYPNRSIDSIGSDIKFFCDNYGNYLHRVHITPRNTLMTMFYIKDPFSHSWSEWKALKKDCNALVIAHISAKEHTSLAKRSGFDGFYTLLGSNGATYAATWKHWQHLAKFASQYRMLFIPSVAPGFAERKRSMRQRHRSNGQYYGVAWRTAIRTGAAVITISSYNDWPHGDQIEDAAARVGFKDYSTPSGKTHKYLDLTSHWIDEFRKQRNKNPPNTCSAFFNNTICL